MDRGCELIQSGTGEHFAALPLQKVQEELDAAKTQMERDGTQFPDETYEDGVIAALGWLMGLQGAPVSESN